MCLFCASVNTLGGGGSGDGARDDDDRAMFLTSFFPALPSVVATFSSFRE